MIQTVLIEDEKKSLKTLETMLGRYCPEIEITGTAGTVHDGKQTIEKLNPDLVFLDIAMPDGDAFDLLNSLDVINFEVIFITAYNEFALKAFHFSALHYLLKPINHTDLVEAVSRYQRNHSKSRVDERIEILNQSLHSNFARISLPTLEGLTILEIEHIIRIEADSNYCQFHLDDGSALLVSKPLSYFEDLLHELNFFRVHNTHIINLNHVRRYNRGRGGMIILTDGSQITVSAHRKKEFLQRLNQGIFTVK